VFSEADIPASSLDFLTTELRTPGLAEEEAFMLTSSAVSSWPAKRRSSSDREKFLPMAGAHGPLIVVIRVSRFPDSSVLHL